MFDNYICPECSGIGSLTTEEFEETSLSICFYCDGTGFASDEDTEEHFYYYEDI